MGSDEQTPTESADYVLKDLLPDLDQSIGAFLEIL